jgi:hypothetical protein
MEEITTTVSKRHRREITQNELDNLLSFCEEFFWIKHFDKLLIREK